MSTATVTCPHCGETFALAPDALAQANGRVRCGSCLRVFDAEGGEEAFIAPAIPQGNDEALASLDVQPMAMAELPGRREAVPTLSWLLLVLLLALAAIQGWQRQQPVERSALTLEQVVVRKHPGHAGALRLVARLGNPTSHAQPLPGLELLFTNQFGEARARRLFTPADYSGGNVEPLAAGRKLQLSLDLADPGRDAVNYVASLRTVTKPAN